VLYSHITLVLIVVMLVAIRAATHRNPNQFPK
jgi:hypothetical protein